MNFYNRYIKLFFKILIALSISVNMYADEYVKEDADFESAMRKVLAHGNLADTNYLSKMIGLTVLVSSKIETPLSYGVIYRYPHFFSGAEISYLVRIKENRRASRIDISFVPQKCQSLHEWGKKWGRKVSSEMLLHAVGTSEKIVWGDEGSVSISNVSYSTGGCEINLSQTFKDPIALSSLEEIPKISVKHITNKLGRLFVIKDYRNSSAINEILNHQSAEYPSLLPSELLAKRSNSKINVHPWILQGMYISINDSGWDSRNDWLWTPKHISARYANFNLPIDIRQVCVTESDLRTELMRRNIGYGDMRNGSLEFNFSDANHIKINMWFNGDCVSSMEVHQLTDVMNVLTRPIIFGVDFSLANNGDDLTDQARLQVDKLVDSLRTKQVEKIHLYGYLVNPNSDAEIFRTKKLIALLRDALTAQGIEESRISVGTLADISLLENWKMQTEVSAVFVDPLVR